MNSRLPLKTYLYFLAQSVNLTTAVMSVTMAALVGASIAPEPSLSTVPYGFQFLLVMLITYPASKLMSRIGRKKSFLLATIPLAASGIIGFLAVEERAFSLLVISHSLLGTYIAFANFNRFAATDNISVHLKPRAISLVVAGGVIAAVIGPMLTTYFKDFGSLQAFSACYAVFTGLAVVSLVLNLLVKEPIDRLTHLHEPQDSQLRSSVVRATFENKTVLLAIGVAAVGYGIMNLLMIQSSMHMSTNMHVHFSDVSLAIQWHVLAMFAPSFFTGIMIQTLGLRVVIFAGIFLLILTSLINILAGSDYYALMATLIALGLGWNFTYVGGSALLTRELENLPGSVKVQGINDLGISIMATIGAFAPAFLLSWLGWNGTNILAIGICLTLLVFSGTILKPNPTSQQ